MKRTANRPQKPNVPKTDKIGGGTDTPDDAENDEESTSTTNGTTTPHSNSVDAPTNVTISNSQANKKLPQLMDTLIEQIRDLQDILNTHSESVSKKATMIITSHPPEELRQKKSTSICAAAIIHAIRLLNLPITMKQILGRINSCEKQTKNILKLFQCSEQPEQPISNQQSIISFLSSIITQQNLAPSFLDVCSLVLDTIEQKNLIGGEQNHVIATTVFKITADLIFRERSFTISQAATSGNCCEYSLKMMIKKLQPFMEDIIQAIIEKFQKNKP